MMHKIQVLSFSTLILQLIFDDAVIDDLTVRIILPEGARNFDFSIPFQIDGQSFDTHFTYLDTTGRPVVVLQKKNVIPREHNQLFQVSYTFSRLSMLQEPFLLIGAYFFFFLFIIIYVRIDISIGTKSSSNLAAEEISNFKSVASKRDELHKSLDNALSKNDNSYTSGKANAESELRRLAQEADKIINAVEKIDPTTAKKLERY